MVTAGNHDLSQQNKLIVYPIILQGIDGGQMGGQMRK